MSRKAATELMKLQLPRKVVQSNEDNEMVAERGERERKPRNGRYHRQQQQQYSPTTSIDTGLSLSPPYTNGRTNGANSYKPSFSPTSTDPGVVSPQSVNGWDYSEVEARYNSMITSLKDELSFLEVSNSNLLLELRESQDSNYVLTEEIRRLQRNNLNTLDELQACQTANSVLRQELQRLEQGSVKMTRESEKYKKANAMLKDEIKDLKVNQNKRKTSMVTLKEKAKDLQKDILEKEKDFKELSSLKQTVNIIIEAVEHDSLNDNGYCPTDSDTTSSVDGGATSNDDIQLNAFTPKPVKRSDTFSGSLSNPISRKFFSSSTSSFSPDLRRRHDGLFGKRQKELMTDFAERSRSRSFNIDNTAAVRSRDQSPSTPDLRAGAAGGRRGSLDSFNKDVNPKETSLRNDTLTRLLGKSLERLTDHKIRRSDSKVRPHSMTFDLPDKTDDDLLPKGGTGTTPITASPEKGTFEL